MFKPKCLIQPINEIYSIQEKKKKKSKTYRVRCACSVPEQNKKNPKFFWIAEWRDRESERERERENPKAETEMVKPPCCEVRRPPPVTARPSLTAPLTPADCCCRRRSRSVTPRAVRPSGSALRSGMFLFCFFFFSSLSFPVLLLHYSWQPCLLV